MLLELLVPTNLAIVDEAENELVKSCTGEPFELVKYVAPRCPIIHGSRRNGIVKLRAYVDQFGVYKDVKVTDATPKRLFDKEARRAVKRWRWNTSEHAERCFDITLEFKLE
ncbi:energy transducer TonB [Psychrobium sp. MM17-31]|uniref:energy transducer TonB n=1 Tax=Psychrobium sp. MM17-31 TaxID=2917758 RepID=UPI001EF52CD2|nr:TonB family protein [Psychrobium sp. MM17-31]MCG7532137.1 energy transducer TonB [Psychrobium sp. MM17-31]